MIFLIALIVLTTIIFIMFSHELDYMDEKYKQEKHEQKIREKNTKELTANLIYDIKSDRWLCFADYHSKNLINLNSLDNINILHICSAIKIDNKIKLKRSGKWGDYHTFSEKSNRLQIVPAKIWYDSEQLKCIDFEPIWTSSRSIYDF